MLSNLIPKRIFALDTATGQAKVNLTTGQTQTTAQLQTGIR